MYRPTPRAVLLPLILAVGLAAGLLFGRFLTRQNTASQLERVVAHLAPSNNKLAQTLLLINGQYVDSVAMDSLYEKAIPAVVGELDPHSVYIPRSEMQALNEPLEGEFDGIGVVFNMATDTVIVLNVIAGGPSDRAGVRNGDRIVRIEDSLVAGRKIPQNDIVHMLRGKRGTSVRLGIERQRIPDPVEVTVVRDAIPLRSLDAAFMLSDEVGYIRLSKFAKTTYTEVLNALVMLRAEGMRRLILDLRGNSGGYLDQPIRVANEFLEPGKLIVYTEDRHRRREEQYSDGKGSFTDIGLALLVDEGTASSSEILAGALQDNDRALVVGRRTFGKGLVQRQFEYGDGSALRLTVAHYYTPTGRSIQKPYTAGDNREYEEELYNRYLHNEYFSADSIRFADSLRFTTPGGRVVYGGGGIMPDRFIAFDTTELTPYFIEVSGRNILYRYTIEYADRNRNALNAVRSVPQLDSLLDADRGLLANFVRYAARQGVAPVPRQIRRSERLILAQLRAFIGRNTALEETGFYAEIYPADEVILAALELLQHPEEP